MYIVFVCEYGKYRIQIMLSIIEVLLGFACSRIDCRLRVSSFWRLAQRLTVPRREKGENA